jgi:inosose dehydratase
MAVAAQGLAGAAAVLRLAKAGAAAAPKSPKSLPTLGFSLYGMKGLELGEAIRTCAALGYDDVEFALMPGFPADPLMLAKTRRRELRDLLVSQGVAVPALMENLPAVVAVDAHRSNLDRIARAAELGRDLSPDRPPLLETVLGGKPADWESLREPMAERLRAWAEVARKHDLVVAVKPHASGALHRPDDAVWLVKAVGSPHIRLVYDYSHYEAQGLPLDATLARLSDHTAFIHIKDGRRVDGKVQFLLPGEGTTDYAAYFRRLVELGYAGSVTVEVSGMIHQRADYDPVAAAKQCYQTLAAAWNKADLPPRKKR